MKKKQKKHKQPNIAHNKKEITQLHKVQPNTILIFSGILLITFIAYWPALKAGIVNWDDPDYVTNNPILKDVSNIKALFTIPIQGNYHPLTVISLIINYKISGYEPWSYHLLNLLLHLINCILVFKLAWLLTNNNVIIATVTSVLFAIHPMHVESVAWISERKDVLYSLFFLLGLIHYTKYIDSGSKKYFWYAVIMLALSLMSKPAAIIFPFVLFCIDYLRKRKFDVGLIMEKIPFFLLSLILGILTFVAQKEKGAVDGSGIFDMSTRILMGFYGFMMYFIKALFPFKLSPFYPYEPINEALPVTYYIGPLFFVLLIVVAYTQRNKNKLIPFGIAFYILNLVLVVQFIPVGSAIIAERYTYIPYIGLFLIAGWLLSRLTKGDIRKSMYVIAPVSIILAFLTNKQSRIWHNGKTLWDQAIKTTPGARAYENRGDLYKEDKKYDSAIYCYSEALKINVADHEAHMKIGNVYFELNKYDQAMSEYRNSLAIKPDYVTAYDNIGAIHGVKLQYDSSLYYFNKALSINPGYASSYKNRALVYVELSKDQLALNDFQKYLEFSPNEAGVINMVGLCYRNLGKYSEGLKEINKAIAIEKDPRFYLNRAYCYRGLNNIAAARADAIFAKQNGVELDASFASSLGIN